MWYLLSLLTIFVGALGFQTVNATISTMFRDDVFTFVSDLGTWDTPNAVLGSTLKLGLIILFVRGAVSFAEAAKRDSKDEGFSFYFCMATVTFAMLFYWVTPFALYIVLGDGYSPTSMFTVETLKSMWGVERYEIYGLIPSSLSLVSVEQLRRQLILKEIAAAISESAEFARG